jgi:hypothetical protein
VRQRRTLIVAVLALALAGVVAGVLGVASAEGPAGSGSPRAISVEGTATVPIAPHDSAAAATGVYREAQAKALADGQAKAAFLAEKLGVALGVATSTVEQGGYIECAGTVDEYAEYEGEQPDFGYGLQPASGAGSGSAVPLSAASPAAPSGTSTHVAHRPKRKPKHPASARASARNTASSCNLTADVALVYAAG